MHAAPNLYSALATVVLFLHALFIVSVAFGAVFTRSRPILRGLHIVSLIWGILTELTPWPCPLTLLENWLEQKAGVEPYEGSARYVRAARAAGLRTAVVSSSSNCREVLRAARIDDLFDAVIDGVVAERRGLHGKPAPDTFLAGAEALGMTPARAAVFEDALAGVAAGRAGGFALVVGVDRVGQQEALLAHGADIVVSDLAELLEAP